MPPAFASNNPPGPGGPRTRTTSENVSDFGVKTPMGQSNQ